MAPTHWARLKGGNLCAVDLGLLEFWLAIWRMKRLASGEKGLVQGRLHWMVLGCRDGDQTVGGVNLAQVNSEGGWMRNSRSLPACQL